MLDEARMAQIAERVVGQVLALGSGESLLIVRDSEDSGPLAQAVIQAANRAGAESVSITMAPRSMGGEELPDPVAGAFLRSNAILSLCQWPYVHTRAASAALQAGARMANLRGYREGLLESPGVVTDYEVVRRNALAVDALLEKAREVHITCPQGTDLRMQLCGRKGKAQTGFAREPGTFTGLPDGESTVAPLEGTTQGRIVNPYMLDKIGVVDEPFRMEIKDGWIVSVEGGKQARELNELFERKDPNARRIASQFAMGMNPDCRIFPSTREVSKRLGTIHVAFGDNISLGGTVQSDLHIDIVVLDVRVELDGQVVLEDGKLNL